MPNTNSPFGSTNTNIRPTDYSWWIVGGLVVIAVLVVVSYTLWVSPSAVCSTTLHRSLDGSLRLEPSGETFPDMNSFQKWWYASQDNLYCPLPILTGAREVPVLQNEGRDEQLYAKTPINNVDDYEFSRIFGYERGGHMHVPRQNFNMILNQRQFDWPNKPMSSDDRRSKYTGLSEGFTTTGDLKSIVMSEPSAEDLVKEATQRYGEKRHGQVVEDTDIDCRISRESREVAAMVAKAYESEPNYEPVITKVGANHWEVNELKPRHRKQEYDQPDIADNTVVDTSNDAVDIAFQFPGSAGDQGAIDPYYPVTGDLPFYSERHSKDPWYGPRPGVERPFGPTVSQAKRWV